MTDEDFIIKDDEGKDIDITEDLVSYIRSVSFLRDIYCGVESKSQKTMGIFLHELKATFVGLIAGIEKPLRKYIIKDIFINLDLMKEFILTDLNTIKNEKEND